MVDFFLEMWSGPVRADWWEGWSLWTAGAALGLAAQFLKRQPIGKPCQEKKSEKPSLLGKPQRVSCFGSCFSSSRVKLCVTSPSETPSQLVCAGSPAARSHRPRVGPGPRCVRRAGSVTACFQPNSLRHTASPGVFFSAENEKSGVTFIALLSALRL